VIQTVTQQNNKVRQALVALAEAIALSPAEYSDAELIVSDGLLRVTDACTFLAIGRDKLYELMDSGELAYVMVGRDRKVPRRELVRYAATQLQ
jgi:excisionase family DNA binding protein